MTLHIASAITAIAHDSVSAGRGINVGRLGGLLLYAQSEISRSGIRTADDFTHRPGPVDSQEPTVVGFAGFDVAV
ncbi:hypothetical protein [Nocardia testacea]|uniref:hypothetical protein n=1 Tax=Nocardia testacea TaxID=248551 RepID=UPI003A85706E